MSFSADHDDLKEQVRSATDIVDLVGSYLELRREGRNFAALCPWHGDSRPSLKVNPERQSWKCWVCDDGGDVFSFVMKKEGVGFREALELLADRARIEVRRGGGPKAEAGSATHKPTLYRVLAWAEQQYHACLQNDPAAQPARDYLRERGLNEQSIERFHLGFVPPGWQWLIDRAAETPFQRPVLEAVGLTLRSEKSRRDYDRFRERLLFSIRDAQKRPVAFGGRVLPGSDESAKYINSPETLLFSKSDQLYGLDLARESISHDRHAVVVEGYTDVIMAHQHGVENVVAVLGTALGPRHIRLLRRFADKVTLVLDGDEAGQRRTNEVLEMFVASPLELRIASLPEGQDPCDFVQQRGADAFRQLIGGSEDALTHKIRVSKRNLEHPDNSHQSTTVLNDILKTLSAAEVGGDDPNNPWRLRIQQVITRLSREFLVDEIYLRERLRDLRRNRRPLAEQVESAPQVVPLPRLNAWDRELFRFLFRHPQFVELAAESVQERHLGNETAVTVWRAVQSVGQRGHVPEFSRVLAEVDDPRLKHVMVEVDETQIQSPIEPQECLEHIIESYRARDTKGICREKVAELEKSEMTADEQYDVFAEILNERRKQQGISAPTEG